jgi:hypothetical protein
MVTHYTLGNNLYCQENQGRGSWYVARGTWLVVRGSWYVVRGTWSWYVNQITSFVARTTNNEQRTTNHELFFLYSHKSLIKHAGQSGLRALHT